MTQFGTTSDGRTVDALTISAHGLSARVLTLGAILQDVRLSGIEHNLTVGAPDLSRYEGTFQYHGAIVGPVANRITNATAVIDGYDHRFEANLDGKHTLHSGTRGTQTRIWDVAHHSVDRLELTLKLGDGDGGFPANRTVTARFEILEGPALRLAIMTTTDATTVANLTNHSYWNLDGSDHMRDHSLQIDALEYLPTDEASFPTGEIAPVRQTPFDFTEQRPLALGSPPVDHTFCITKQRRALTEVLHLTGANGLSMRVATTETGMHIYDNRPAHDSIAIEAQGWPDAPRHNHFPSIEVAPQAPIEQITQWRFSR
ncbi:aldose epimerase family protein [Octadecabacter ascidiaceicola]|uniref:Aldose 1-epimerase n=1 Tax=Octadecabacter ascidiaceicola TaxID=1655543 RepID=A0A238KMN1_9RHOB|nr:aldose epimerase family protein [Octadecabacter ascidiaceicola]SMX43412.1 Aldose 1-epimerase precursor [Octadecabacter ascidiaceicola]